MAREDYEALGRTMLSWPPLTLVTYDAPSKPKRVIGLNFWLSGRASARVLAVLPEQYTHMIDMPFFLSHYFLSLRHCNMTGGY